VEYYYLKKDEVIKKGDEVDACGDAWRDDPVWVPAVHTVGQRAPDPQYVSHRQYRRPIKRNADSSTNKANGGSEAEAQICPICGGVGEISGIPPVKCHICNGTGKLHHS